MANSPYYVGGKFGGFGEAPAETAPRPGMFGGGRNWGRTIADFLTNFSAGMGNPAALATMQNRFQMQQQGGEVKARELARQQGLEDHWTQFQREQQYRLSHPAPPDPTTLQRDVEYYRSINRSDLADQLLANHANPLVGVDVQSTEGGPVERRWMRPGSPTPQAPAVLNELPPNAVPIPAGGAASGPRSFR